MDNTSFYIIENKLENLERASEALESFRRSANLTKTDARWCDEVISPMVNDLATKLHNLYNQLQKLDDEAEKFFAFNA